MPEEHINIRDCKDYDEVHNAILDLLDKYELSYVEAFGLLQCVTSDLHRQYQEEKEE